MAINSQNIFDIKQKRHDTVFGYIRKALLNKNIPIMDIIQAMVLNLIQMVNLVTIYQTMPKETQSQCWSTQKRTHFRFLKTIKNSQRHSILNQQKMDIRWLFLLVRRMIHSQYYHFQNRIKTEMQWLRLNRMSITVTVNKKKQTNQKFRTVYL